MQNSRMLYDPVEGIDKRQPYPSHAAQYRAYHGNVAWLYNPWNGLKIDPRDIGSDVLGLLIEAP